MSDPRILVTVPILPSLDFDATADFYSRLGFSLVSRWPDYLILSRDGVQIHFWKCGDPALPGASGCYIRVADVHGLHAQFVQAGLKPHSQPELRAWEQYEFHMVDPHGNLLRFGQQA